MTPAALVWLILAALVAAWMGAYRLLCYLDDRPGQDTAPAAAAAWRAADDARVASLIARADALHGGLGG